MGFFDSPISTTRDWLFGSNTPAGAQPATPSPASVTIKNVQGQIYKQDLRVKISVPPSYIKYTTSGLHNELARLGGIIFPYTPNITYENKADYSALNPTHGNFTQYFYKSSSVTPISITGKFTVQNEQDAGVYLATVHLLKALTKMRFGKDTNAGSPPPVCRLDAYGTFMISNAPIAISSFRVDLPDNVDYYTLGKVSPDATYDQASVPVISSIILNCNLMYSRQELKDFSVDKWLSENHELKQTKGYL